MSICICVVQALPGSRLDTSLLKEWLMQHLASLHSCQSQVSAAETAYRQKRHVAAAAAAVTAAKLEAGEEEEDEEASAEGASQQLGCALTLPGHDTEASVQLPARVVAAAAAASAAAMETAITAHKADIGAVSKLHVYVQHIQHICTVQPNNSCIGIVAAVFTPAAMPISSLSCMIGSCIISARQILGDSQTRLATHNLQLARSSCDIQLCKADKTCRE